MNFGEIKFRKLIYLNDAFHRRATGAPTNVIIVRSYFNITTTLSHFPDVLILFTENEKWPNPGVKTVKGKAMITFRIKIETLRDQSATAPLLTVHGQLPLVLPDAGGAEAGGVRPAHHHRALVPRLGRDDGGADHGAAPPPPLARPGPAPRPLHAGLRVGQLPAVLPPRDLVAGPSASHLDVQILWICVDNYRYVEILYLLLLTSHSSRLATPATSGTSVLRMVTDSGGTETTTLR